MNRNRYFIIFFSGLMGLKSFFKNTTTFFSKRLKWLIGFGLLIGFLLTLLGNMVINITSSDAYCMSCHAHPHAEQLWRLSTHYDNRSGVFIHCVECHLPPKGQGHLKAKIKHGSHDVWAQLTKDIETINWEEKSRLENAVHYTYREGCIHCHENLFPTTLSKKGDDAHLYYTQHEDELRCINCHLHVGHYSETAIHAENVEFGKSVSAPSVIYPEAADVDSFADYTEYIPGTSVAFEMVAIPAGSFNMGSPPDEPFREEDEGPVKTVNIGAFWMGRVEVTWDEYLAFFNATESEGRTRQSTDFNETDAISGATPPWGAPDQGWGKGSRPAITMSHHAAQTYCRWLSSVTGKTYRLPSEAEWEYAARAGTDGPYFFEADPRKITRKRYYRRLSESDTTNITALVIFDRNSAGKTQEPESVYPNPFGLKNMLGNVAEFCLDWYAPDIYTTYEDGIQDPMGPVSGSEHVIRGGSYRSSPEDLRVAARDHTRTDAWLKTDPQMPKSIWWYSDCNYVGFRVVCEVPQDLR